jgi:flagellar motility protein MotE (MotC chaperone)
MSQQIQPTRRADAVKPAKARPRLLPTFAVLVCVAGGLRLVSGIGAAVALDAPPSGTEQTVTGDDGSAVRTAAARPANSAETAEFLLSLSHREQALQAREEALEERAQSLAHAERRLAEKLEALRLAEEELAGTMARADRAAEDDIDRLVQVYEAMKPEEAARVFAEMEIQFAAGFFSRLRPEIAAPILAGLEPRQAYALSALIAGRNALVPRREDGER